MQVPRSPQASPVDTRATRPHAVHRDSPRCIYAAYVFQSATTSHSRRSFFMHETSMHAGSPLFCPNVQLNPRGRPTRRCGPAPLATLILRFRPHSHPPPSFVRAPSHHQPSHRIPPHRHRYPSTRDAAT